MVRRKGDLHLVPIESGLLQIRSEFVDASLQIGVLVEKVVGRRSHPAGNSGKATRDPPRHCLQLVSRRSPLGHDGNLFADPQVA
jgi:hypothetical protein